MPARSEDAGGPSLRISAANGAIGVVGERLVAPDGRFDLELQIPDGRLYPGLINAHDHLHRNHYGRLGAPPYADAYEWGRDIHARCAREIADGRTLARRDALLHGAWKNLLAGVTTVVHHDAWEPDFDRAFPLRVVPIRNAHSLGAGNGLDGLDDGRGPFCIHVAEGVNDTAAEEVRELARRELLNPRLLAVHVVGADTDGVERLRACGAAVVWCPSSNDFLFGRTAPAALLAPGIDVLLGSDALLTGAGTLLDELRAAARTGLMADSRLRDAVAGAAARRLGLEPPALAVGARADVVVLRRAIGEATARDVAAVVAGGVLRVLDTGLRTPERWQRRGRIVTRAGVSRRVFGDVPATLAPPLRSPISVPPGT
ncbi:MAG TPA: hypothetical protein VK939_02490 [Longimicrobiales bacterium]|nr:hypothetical protein [Longimicrobiales bacterium]